MQLKSLALTNFKNIGEARLDFSPNVNCLVGNNGMGKTNLLDAIHCLSFCRSHSLVPDAMLVSAGETFYTLKGDYLRRDVEETLTMGYVIGRRKTLKRGSKDYKRFADHIGLFPLVMTGPNDADLVRGSGEERRRWMDMVISQADAVYFDALIRYSDALQQRNRLLRDHVVDHLLYESVEAILQSTARLIVERRREKLEQLKPLFIDYYTLIAGGADRPDISYAPNTTDFPATLANARRHDEIVGHTSVGPHRDDIELTVCGMPMRKVGSQGQSKTFTLAMRLAQFDFLAEATGLRPLLLLDDIFDKLDARRVERIVDLVAGERFGQIFITDTNRTHLDTILRRLADDDRRLWTVEDGHFTQTEI